MITVLYEDHRSGQRDFAFHDFLIRLVQDGRGPDQGTLWELRKQAEALPCNGNTKLLKRLGEEMQMLVSGGGRLLAVLDADQIRAPLKLSAGASLEDCRQSIVQKCAQPDLLDVAFLVENIESVLEAIRICNPGLLPDRMQLALYKGREALLNRDLIFREAAREANRALRDCILSRMPSLGDLVALLNRRLQEALPETQPETLP